MVQTQISTTSSSPSIEKIKLYPPSHCRNKRTSCVRFIPQDIKQLIPYMSQGTYRIYSNLTHHRISYAPQFKRLNLAEKGACKIQVNMVISNDIIASYFGVTWETRCNAMNTRTNWFTNQYKNSGWTEKHVQKSTCLSHLGMCQDDVVVRELN